MKHTFGEKFPIPQITAEAQQSFIDLIDIILQKKEKIARSSLINGNIGINISHLPSGVYFVRIGNKAEKFVKW